MLSRNDKGVALLTALGVLVILALLGSVFLAHMRLETVFAGRDAQQLKAYYLAIAGIEDAVTRLSADSTTVDAATDSWWTGPSAKFAPLGEGGYKLVISDEASRIDVLTASPQILGTLIGGNKEALASILNFRSSHKIFSIDDFVGAGLDQSVSARLKTLGTVLGDERVNINTAGADVLAALPGMDAATGQLVVEFRKGPDGVEGTRDDFVFSAPADLVKVPGLTPLRVAPALPFVKVNSNLFSVESVGSVQRGVRTVSAKTIRTAMRRDANGRIHIDSWQGF